MVNEILLVLKHSKQSNNNYAKRQILSLTIIFLLILNQAVAQTAAFTINTSGNCTPFSANLTDKSTGATSWQWDLGNSNTSTDPNPSSNYIFPGEYTIRLNINGGGSANLVSIQTLKVYPAPKPTIPNSIKGCEPFSGTLTAEATPETTLPFMIGNSNVGGITGGAPVSYSWNFAGALPSKTTTSPNLNLTNVPAGSYDVLLTVTDEYGCSNSIFKQNAIYVSPKPNADFTITKENTCGTGKVTFTGTSIISSGSIASYTWDIGNDGTIESIQKDFSYTFTSAGTYNIALRVTSDEGCTSDVTVKQVIFNNDNSVGFSVVGGCINKAASFTDESGNNAIKWLWDFDNNGTIDDTIKNPFHIYSTQGEKIAKLKVVFNDGCEMETTKSIFIPEVKADFTFNNSTCAPAYSIPFHSTSTISTGSTIAAYAWDFNNDNLTDDITPDPTHNFNASGTFPVRLIVNSSEGCADTIFKDVFIPDASLDFLNSLSQGCAPTPISFSPVYANTLDPVISYSWNFGDVASGANNTSSSPNPTHNYNNAGEYDVKLTAITTNGCTLEKTKLKNIKIGTPQIINSVVYSQEDLCQKTPVNLNASFSGTVDKLVWDFGDGSPVMEQIVTAGATTAPMTYTYPKPGTYAVTVEAWSNGCPSINSVSSDSIVINEPTAEFTPSSTSECSFPATIIFTNTSISKPENTRWEWDFGDGTPVSNVQHPTHIYSTTGDFEVKLTVINDTTGCTAEAKNTIYINTSNPQFTANNTLTCSGTPVEFTNQVEINASPNYVVASYLWDFGDGESSGDANPSHTYYTPGLYSVSLIVSGVHGCTDTISKADYINVRGPIVDFTKDKTQICSGTLVTFTDATTKATTDDANPLLNEYLWDFGDGKFSNDKNATHTFEGNGKFTISLQVTDNHGCVGTKTVLDSIVIAPLFGGFSTTRDVYCADSTNIVAFTNTATGAITSYDWDLDGDGIFEIINGTASQSRIFPKTGNFKISQRVNNIFGCDDIFSKTIRIVDGNAGINLKYMSEGCAPVSTVFEAMDPDSIVSAYIWRFGDGVTSSVRNPSHDFLRPGRYIVTLTEILTGGCARTNTDTIIIKGPVGTFSYSNTPGCAPHTTIFHADNLSGLSELIWDFGDGTTTTETILPTDTSTSKTISHTYLAFGSKLPILILRDTTCGAFSFYDTKKRINISETPIAAFSAATISGLICEKFSLQFTDESVIVDTRYPVSTWDWNFGDGTAHSYIQNPTHIYDTPGNYTISLTISNGFQVDGCTASVSHDITVNPLPAATSTTQIQSIYTGLVSQDIVLSSLLAGTTYTWTRTNPAGITTTQPMSGNVSTDGIIAGASFENATTFPITVTYTILPFGPTAAYCEGNTLIATITVNPNPLVSIIKTAGNANMNNNGTFNLEYTIKLINNSDQAIDSVQVFENLDDVFKNSGCTYTVTSIIASGSLTANGLFNGSGITATLTEGKSLGAHQQDSIVIKLEIDSHKQENPVTVYNQALLSGVFLSNELSIPSDSDPVTTEFEPTQTEIPVIDVFIPDAFSPNQDIVNEHFVITHSVLVKIDIEVFNRWGNSVYKSTDYQNDWDGKGTGNFLGNDLPSGTYYCIYKVINISTGEVINNGIKYITLRR